MFGRCSPALREEMRSFLKHCRSRLQPEDVGLGRVGRRRVPGLRREEVAELVGVSATWYRLFEMGTSHTVSLRFLRAVNDALRLQEHERRYLFALCNVPADVGDTSEPLDEQFEAIFERPHDVPFALLDDSLRVIAHNRLFAKLRVLPDRRDFLDRWNLASTVYETKTARRLYVNWEEKADAVCSFLRMNLARDLPGVHTNVARLRTLPEFESRWQQFNVMDPSDANIDVGFRHPRAGIVHTRMLALAIRDNHHHLFVQTPSDGDSRERLHWLSTQ